MPEKLPDDKRDDKSNESIQSQVTSAYSKLGEYIGLGLQIALSFSLFVFLGNWVDEYLGTRPIFLLVGVVMGMTGMILLLLKTAANANKKNSNSA
ncbi:MAG: AtpZ/AtpI family protein [Chlorobiales bacterium]|nr:AtpZ/AtpI family protein [Chlorobiales bacterium]